MVIGLFWESVQGAGEEKVGQGECNNDNAEVLQLPGLTKQREAAEKAETHGSPNVLHPVLCDTQMLWLCH